MVTKGSGGGRVKGLREQDIGIVIYNLLCIKQITNKNLLNALWYPKWNGKPKRKGYMYTYPFTDYVIQ